ncbi:MAG: hypothetical protein AAFY67_17340 [Cyanobacteria bacterium J06642_9]
MTEGHELMELLFDAWEQVLAGQSPDWQVEEKERWCDRGAAELLMPKSSFVPQLQTLGMSLQAGQTLAKLYTTSLMATLLHMIQHTVGSHALVMWHPAHSRQELTHFEAAKSLPPKELRVWWRSCSPGWTGGFISWGIRLVYCAYCIVQLDLGLKSSSDNSTIDDDGLSGNILSLH